MENLRASASDSNGNFYLTLQGSDQGAILKLDQDGKLLRTWAIETPNVQMSAIAVADTGEVVVIGRAKADIFVQRLNSS